MNQQVLTQAELDEFEERLVKMDFRLRKAKQARDEYVDFLRQKYPFWKPTEISARPPPTSSLQGANKRILDILATSKYHWNLGKQQHAPETQYEPKKFEPNDPIPSRGPALEPDLQRIRKRLAEIASDLENLREHRLHLSTTEYFHSIGHQFWSTENRELPGKKTDSEPLRNFYLIRRQIEQIGEFAFESLCKLKLIYLHSLGVYLAREYSFVNSFLPNNLLVNFTFDFGSTCFIGSSLEYIFLAFLLWKAHCSG
ncbi:unnamed protein product [Gongylonema pulchrum]|uniref:Uncharacterized protein n=1 Tax=Gongylonema pulchrum TaxID=637853 RepID=A0A183EBQ4_9BILA|nr:unnamed protein product [Gongylonema pulchrum]